MANNIPFGITEKALLEQILNKYMNELMKEDSCTAILSEVLNDRISYDNSYNNLRHLDLIRKCNEIKELYK